MTLTEKIRKAGIVGMGGAGFPTHVKLDASPETLIINCAECEPVLRNDRVLIKCFAARLVRAIEALNTHYGGIRRVFAIKETYGEEIAALEKAIAEAKSGAEIFRLRGYYPAGDEQLVTYEVTGKTVPPAGIPLDTGTVVINAATLYAISYALEDKPLIKRFVTVAGEVRNPLVLRVPIGTSFADCVRAAGGETSEDFLVVSGGPMMGKILSRAEAQDEHVKKTTSGIILLKRDGKIGRNAGTDFALMKRRAASACIQCRTCTDLCPRHNVGHPIEPHLIMRAFAYSADMESILDNENVRAAAICSECGVCELYACPMGLQPRALNSVLKTMLRERGVKYEKGKGAGAPDFYREDRLVPSFRAAVRAGVSGYYDGVNADGFTDVVPGRLEISLSQGIGVPAVPSVRTGDRVNAGDLVAKCPEGKLGADVHAGIAGVCRVLGDRIVIE